MLLVASLSSVLLAFCFFSFNVQVNSWKTPYRTLRRPCSLSVQQKDAEPVPITSSKQYLNKGDRPYLIGSRPESAVWLGALNFRKEISQIFVQIGNTILQSEQSKRQSFPDLLGLRLSNEAVKQAERDRIAAGGGVDAHPISQKLYDIGCSLLDNLFDEKPIERFWFLETVARIPYFVYVSMLHLYESLGWWREPSLRKIHNAEEWNELHHLLILETMGGDKRWSTRFFGFHAAIVYYWLLIATYLYSPRIAYQFMELLEAHAVDTYGTFVTENAERLKQLPAPDIAVTYYKGSDLYTFDDFQVDRPPGTRRPPCDNLYDVFSNIRDDEMEHVTTMRACQDYAANGKEVLSPHERFRSKIITSSIGFDGSEGDVSSERGVSVSKRKVNAGFDVPTVAKDTSAQREKWVEWAEEVNSRSENSNI